MRAGSVTSCPPQDCHDLGREDDAVRTEGDEQVVGEQPVHGTAFGVRLPSGVGHGADHGTSQQPFHGGRCAGRGVGEQGPDGIGIGEVASDDRIEGTHPGTPVRGDHEIPGRPDQVQGAVRAPQEPLGPHPVDDGADPRGRSPAPRLAAAEPGGHGGDPDRVRLERCGQDHVQGELVVPAQVGSDAARRPGPLGQRGDVGRDRVQEVRAGHHQGGQLFVGPGAQVVGKAAHR